MRAAARVLALLTAGALAVGMSGCVGRPHPAPSPTGAFAPLVPITEPDVLRYCPTMPATHYDGLVLAVELVYICRADGRRPTDGVTTFGPWQSVVQVLAPATLLRAYSVADAPQDTTACTVSEPPVDPLIIWVWQAGAAHAYYAPLDVCGFPQTRAAQDYSHASEGRVIVQIDTGGVQDPSRTDGKDQP